jgi:hypothetical protein
MQEKCRKCGAILFNKVLIDDKGHWAIDEKIPLALESEAGDNFFRCPACKAKNIVVSATSIHDLPQLKISHTKD